MRVIQENALFIADSHYPHHGESFLTLLQKIETKLLNPPQLFLMGDNFDLLFGHNDYIQTFSKEAINLLQKLSKELEIIYLEGNHDFCLKEIFPNIQVYAREEQPIHCRLNTQDIYLSHGDKYETGFGYDLYCKILRNKTTLTLLKPFQTFIINDRMKRLKGKKICGTFKNYKKRFDAIRTHYPQNSLIIEGHFHQSLVHENYVSLPSLACQKKVAMVQNGEIVFNKIEILQ
ncbi:MAG TPA: UDP-2,3-diacylglucosamine diphosphatase [Campylobacterales bacterium]|nr:UDP-2,3-diacylglucosamine diphosphatase [Campylobacterales bacterium]HHS92400.1 UDP-2,3-diacylglucosamine diphosphatase [Campylobacterales bacterium]